MIADPLIKIKSKRIINNNTKLIALFSDLFEIYVRGPPPVYVRTTVWEMLR